MAAHSLGSRFGGLLLIITMLAALLQCVAAASVHHKPAASTKKVQHYADTTTPRILVPLYVYPTPNAWDPLYTAIRNNPTAAFTVIINPNSGPGAGTAPDSDYSAAIKTLRASAGANQILELVGYVPTGYGKRSVAAVKADVKKYAGWPASVAMDGIFLDEAPTASTWLKQYTGYTDLVRNTKWASTTSNTSSKAKTVKAKNAKHDKKEEHEKQKKGKKEKKQKKVKKNVAIASRPGITILNPGTWPETDKYFTIADHIVVYEDKLSNFK